MSKRTYKIPLAVCKDILLKSGAKRVADPAQKALSMEILDFAEELSARAVRIALHSGRKTVKEGDIRLARE